MKKFRTLLLFLAALLPCAAIGLYFFHPPQQDNHEEQYPVKQVVIIAPNVGQFIRDSLQFLLNNKHYNLWLITKEGNRPAALDAKQFVKISNLEDGDKLVEGITTLARAGLRKESIDCIITPNDDNLRVLATHLRTELCVKKGQTVDDLRAYNKLKERVQDDKEGKERYEASILIVDGEPNYFKVNIVYPGVFSNEKGVTHIRCKKAEKDIAKSLQGQTEDLLREVGYKNGSIALSFIRKDGKYILVSVEHFPKNMQQAMNRQMLGLSLGLSRKEELAPSALFQEEIHYLNNKQKSFVTALFSETGVLQNEPLLGEDLCSSDLCKNYPSFFGFKKMDQEGETALYPSLGDKLGPDESLIAVFASDNLSDLQRDIPMFIKNTTPYKEFSPC